MLGRRVSKAPDLREILKLAYNKTLVLAYDVQSKNICLIMNANVKLQSTYLKVMNFFTSFNQGLSKTIAASA